MSSRSRIRSGNGKAPAAARSWSIILLKNRGQFLGFVDAPDKTAAALVATRSFNLSQHDRRRLLVLERR